MEGFTVERFKEEEFTIKEFLEEVYGECRREGAKRTEEVLQEIERIKEAVEYKEKELQAMPEERVSREEVEELAGSLASVELSVESKKFLRAVEEKRVAEKKIRFIEYLEIAEKKGFCEEVRASTAERWEELAEFAEIITKIDGVEESVKDSVQEGSAYLKAAAKRAYAKAIEEGEIEKAGGLAAVLSALGCKEYPIEALLCKKPEGYIRSAAEKVELIDGMGAYLHGLAAYMERVGAEAERAVLLCRTVLMRRERVEESEYSDSLFCAFKRTVESMVVPVVEEIYSAEDPYEYLEKVEFTMHSLRALKARVSKTVPRCKEKILKTDFLRYRPEEAAQKEVEGLQAVLSGLLETLKGSGALPYTLRGESITAVLNSPFDVVFRFLAVCRRGLLRAKTLEYSQHALEFLVGSQIAGCSLLLEKACEKYTPRPFSLLGMHLNVYLCIKKMYRDATTQENAAAVSEGVKMLTRAENARSKTILGIEKKVLHDALEKHLETYEASEAIEEVEKALKPLSTSSLKDTVGEDVLNDHAHAVKTRIFTRTSKDAVKRLILYLKETKRFAKSIEAYTAEKVLGRLRVLTESLLVDTEDVQRVLDSVAATPKETMQIQHARGLLDEN